MTDFLPPAATHRIATIEALEALYGAPVARSIAKEARALTPAYRRWIEAAPFVALATSGPHGLDCSPRGDPAAVVTVLDDRHVAVPDRRGNNRLDSLRNIVADPRVGLLFLIPGITETLRVNGRAEVTVDPDLRRRLAMDGAEPATVILVRIEAVYFQCARALIRSDLWDPDRQLDRSAVPTAGEMTKAVDPDFDSASYDAALANRQRATLY